MKYHSFALFVMAIGCLSTLGEPASGQTENPALLGGQDSSFSTPRFIHSSTEQGVRATEQQGQAAEQPNAGQYSRGSIVAQTAQVSCIYKIQLSAQADGLIQELLVDEGSVVSKGDPILIIDSRVARAERAVAEKQLESAQIIAQQTANIEFSKAASELAKEEFFAERELLMQRATTQASLKRKELEMRKTMFSVDMATDEQRKYQLEAAVAQEQVNASQVKLELYQVVAPFDGIVVERKRAFGEWIRAGEPVIRLLHMNEMKVEAFVPLSGVSLASLEGADMVISVDLGPIDKMEFTAKVGFVSPELDTQSVRVTTRVQNQQVGGSWILRDGMHAHVEIIPLH